MQTELKNPKDKRPCPQIGSLTPANLFQYTIFGEVVVNCGIEYSPFFITKVVGLMIKGPNVFHKVTEVIRVVSDPLNGSCCLIQLQHISLTWRGSFYDSILAGRDHGITTLEQSCSWCEILITKSGGDR